MSVADSVIARLKERKFKVDDEHRELFGEVLSPLRAVAVDHRTHQLVLVAEQERANVLAASEGEFERSWRELLFAASGLRHHLRGSAPPALSAPIILAIVDDHGAYRLRQLVEEIAEEYVLFTRIDVTIIEMQEVAGNDEALDLAMAPVLPCVRDALANGVTVATQDVERFWQELRSEIQDSVARIAKDFGGMETAETTDRLILELRDRGVGEIDGEEPLRPPWRIANLALTNFRSFDEAEFSLPAVALVHGANGSGKTSVCEALEIAWSGGTQRMPGADIEMDEYERHLKRNGATISIRFAKANSDAGDDLIWDERTELMRPGVAALGRTVLAQHTLSEMVDSAPKDRLEAFRKVSGLALPELEKKRIDALRRAAFDAANEALRVARIEPLQAVTRSALSHLQRALESDFSAALPPPDQLEGAIDALARASGGAYAGAGRVDSNLADLLRDADAALGGAVADLAGAADPSPYLAAAESALRSEAQRLREVADPLRQVAQQISRQVAAQSKVPERAVDMPSPPVPPGTAARWLGHVRGLEQSVSSLDDLAPGIDDESWRLRLGVYTKALRAAIRQSSANQLEQLAKEDRSAERSPRIVAELDRELLRRAGFPRSPEWSRNVVAAMGELQAQLSERAARLEELAAGISRHPGRSFVSRAARIMPLLFRFEVIRELANQRGAIARAQETLVTELLDGRLFPVVRELVAALVRFDWYFKPLKMQADKKGLHMSGIANDDETQDVRYLLNAAERTVVGIAWFLALHLLQHEDDRRVLVLDDPASGFDSTNKAAFVATLRAVVLLLEPEQVLITTHDDALVALLEQEFAVIDRGLEVLRCRRKASGVSEIRREAAGSAVAPAVNLAGELRKLLLEPDESPSLP
jgi:hypothetical protein